MSLQKSISNYNKAFHLYDEINNEWHLIDTSNVDNTKYAINKLNDKLIIFKSYINEIDIDLLINKYNNITIKKIKHNLELFREAVFFIEKFLKRIIYADQLKISVLNYIQNLHLPEYELNKWGGSEQELTKKFISAITHANVILDYESEIKRLIKGTMTQAAFNRIFEVLKNRIISNNNKFVSIKEYLSVDLISKWLPAKSKAEIDKAIEGKTPEEIFKLGYTRNIPYLVTLALNKGVDPSDYNNEAIRWASERGHLEVVKLLLADKRVDPSVDNNVAIRWASRYGHLEVVKLLLADKRVDPSDKNNGAIRWAASRGHIEVVKLLLDDKRVDPSTYDNLAIRNASYNGHVEVVKLLLGDKRVYNSLSKEDRLKYKK